MTLKIPVHYGNHSYRLDVSSAQTDRGSIEKRDVIGGSRYKWRPAALSIVNSRWLELLLEQVVKCFASVIRPDRGKATRRRCRRSSYGCGSRVLLDSRAKAVKGAFISSIFFGDAFGYRPGTFKLRRSIEVCALLAAVQMESAARTTAIGIKTLLQNSAAI
jgi:hypothetical protein